MLFVIDVGNTNSVLGLFREEKLVAHWRLTTDLSQTADEYGILIRTLFTLDGIDPQQITSLMICKRRSALEFRSGGNGAEVFRTQGSVS